jgi:hypothetical protein
MDHGKTDQDYFLAMFDAAKALAEGPFVIVAVILVLAAIFAAWVTVR